MNNADHGPDLSGYEAGVGFNGVATASDHIVGYLGEVEQAQHDHDAWVATGSRPPASTTNYRIDVDSQVQLATTADQLHGVQPVVILTAIARAHRPSSDKVDVVAGEPVTLSVEAEVPPGAGKVVKAEWDFEGAGSYTARRPLAHISPRGRAAPTRAIPSPSPAFTSPSCESPLNVVATPIHPSAWSRTSPGSGSSSTRSLWSAIFRSGPFRGSQLG